MSPVPRVARVEAALRELWTRAGLGPFRGQLARRVQRALADPTSFATPDGWHSGRTSEEGGPFQAGSVWIWLRPDRDDAWIDLEITLINTTPWGPQVFRAHVVQAAFTEHRFTCVQRGQTVPGWALAPGDRYEPEKTGLREASSESNEGRPTVQTVPGETQPARVLTLRS